MGDISHRHVHVTFTNAGFAPPVDVYETETSLVVVCELAGVAEDSLEVLIEEDVLVVRGERRECCPAVKLRIYQMEIVYGRFERHTVLPAPVVAEGIRAVYENGLLRVELPKGNPGRFSGRIPIT